MGSGSVVECLYSEKRMNSTWLKAGSAAVVLAIAGGLFLLSRPHSAAAAVESVTEKGTVRQIKLPEVDATLPPGPGREAVIAHCGTCHTQAYILLQPAFPRATW